MTSRTGVEAVVLGVKETSVTVIHLPLRGMDSAYHTRLLEPRILFVLARVMS
jgi:hypothetical protein